MNLAEPMAFVFPGQGSQFPGMGRELNRCGAAAGELIATAESVTGLPVSELMNRASAVTIADPEIAQVLVFVWSQVVARELTDRRWYPQAVAGHSVGEYTALAACGSIDVETALRLVAFRGKAMAAAARRSPGSMAAIVGLDQEVVRSFCVQHSVGDELAVVANVNSPRQVVVSGTTAALTQVMRAAREAGALRARRLPVGGAYHSPLMDSASEVMADLLESVSLATPQVPLVSSTTGRVVTDIQAYRADLVRQLASPVLWRDTVETLKRLGVRIFLEAGPGHVLCGLGREMVRSARHLTAQEVLRRATEPVSKESL